MYLRPPVARGNLNGCFRSHLTQTWKSRKVVCSNTLLRPNIPKSKMWKSDKIRKPSEAHFRIEFLQDRSVRGPLAHRTETAELSTAPQEAQWCNLSPQYCPANFSFLTKQLKNITEHKNKQTDKPYMYIQFRKRENMRENFDWTRIWTQDLQSSVQYMWM